MEIVDVVMVVLELREFILSQLAIVPLPESASSSVLMSEAISDKFLNNYLINVFVCIPWQYF